MLTKNKILERSVQAFTYKYIGIIKSPGADVARFKYFQSRIKYANNATKHNPIVQKFQTRMPPKARFLVPMNSVFNMKILIIAPPKR